MNSANSFAEEKQDKSWPESHLGVNILNTKEAVIEALARTVFDHGALNNEFYRRWPSTPMKLHEVEIFARNYWARTRRTAMIVALSLLRAKPLSARVEIVKSIYSELGCGDAKRAHSVRLQNYLLDLPSRLARRSYTANELEAGQVLTSTSLFIEEQDALYAPEGQGHPSSLVLGALLAQEWLAYSMLTRLYEGARNYQYLYSDNDEFHGQCEYFYIHIGEAEKSHKVQSITAAALECHSEEDLVGLTTGFNRFLDITEAYWNGIAGAIEGVGELDANI